MARTGPKLSQSIMLPTAATLPAEQLRLLLGRQSAQTVWNWQKLYGFPQPLARDGREAIYLTCHVADWCRAQGREVHKI